MEKEMIFAYVGNFMQKSGVKTELGFHKCKNGGVEVSLFYELNS